MAIFALYLDDSGSHPQSNRYTLSGGFAPIDNWLRLTEEWDALRKAFGIEWFHMVDAESGHGEFEGWDKPERYAAIDAFSTIVHRHVSHGLVSSFDFKCWRELVEPLHKAYARRQDGARQIRAALGKPYEHAYALTIDAVAKMCNAINVNPGDVEIFLAHQKGHEWSSSYFWHWHRVRLGVNQPIYKEPREYPALQAADMFAWRQNRSFTHPDEPVPARHRKLVDIPRARGWMDRKLIEDMAESMERCLAETSRAIEAGEDPIAAVDALYKDEPAWPVGRLEFPPT